MALKALPGDVFVECEPRAMQVGKIIIPGKVGVTNLPMVGRVRAVGGFLRLGNGTTMPPEFSIGDRVAFDRYKGLLLNHDGKSFMKIKQHEVVAVLGEDVEVNEF